MNQLDIRLLQSIKGYPSVSILAPTHRTSPDNRQDPILIKNLMTEATERLLSEFPKREIDPLLKRLEETINNIDYQFTLDGLCIFVNQDIARVFRVPFSIPARVVIDETFATRDLVHALNRATRYWVLALSEQDTRLFEGERDTLIEITEHGFPLRHTGPGGDDNLPGGPGVNKSAYRDERHRQFFRQVDEAFSQVVGQDTLPLVLVGVDRYLAFYDEITSHKRLITATVTGSHDKTSEYELGQLVWPAIKEELTARRQGRLQELDTATGARKVVSTAEEIWRYALDGRGETLFVEEGFHFAARLDESGRHLTPADDATAPDVIDDAVDEIIEAVIEKGGEVVFVEDGSLDKHRRIALIQRY